MTSSIDPPRVPESAPRAGQMTAVMRAVASATGPKMLRMAVVRGGRVLEERLLQRGVDVTVGPTERSTFLVPREDLPEGVRLLAWSGGACSLQVPPGMSARVTGRGAAVELAPGQAARAVPLDDDARVRATLGATTFLLQFVPAPVRAPVPKLPLSVRQGLAGDIDWRTMFIASFSFLFHFGAIGTAYADWADSVVDDEARLAQTIESIGKPPPALPAVEVPDPGHDEHAPADRNPAPAPHPSPPTGGRIRPLLGGGEGGPRRGMTNGRAIQIGEELARLNLEVVAVLNGGGAATEGVLNGRTPVDLLEAIAGRDVGVGTKGPGGLDLGNGGPGFVKPGQLGRPLVADTTRQGPIESGKAIEVKKPIGVTNPGPPTVTGGDLPGAGATVAGMRAGFRACYKHGLDIDPSMQGSVRITARIGPNGEVTSASPAASGTLSAEVVACMVRRVRSGPFDAPAGGGVTLVIPISVFTQ